MDGYSTFALIGLGQTVQKVPAKTESTLSFPWCEGTIQITIDCGGIKIKLKFFKNYNWKIQGVSFQKQKAWIGNRAISHEENISVPANQPEPVPTISNEPVRESEPYVYPTIFRHQSHEHSYSAKLRIVEDCKNCYQLCEVCPAGRGYANRIEYALLGINHRSALFGCVNSERCQDYLVKVIFQ